MRLLLPSSFPILGCFSFFCANSWSNLLTGKSQTRLYSLTRLSAMRSDLVLFFPPRFLQTQNLGLPFNVFALILFYRKFLGTNQSQAVNTVFLLTTYSRVWRTNRILLQNDLCVFTHVELSRCGSALNDTCACSLFLFLSCDQDSQKYY